MEKVERNALIIELVQEGLPHRDILTKLREKGYTELKDLASVKGTVQRLRKRQLLPAIEPGISKGTQKSVSGSRRKKKRVEEEATEGFIKVSYYITREMKRGIGFLGVMRDVDRSVVAREALTAYLRKQRDLPELPC